MKIPILYYHRVGQFRDHQRRKLNVSPEAFRQQMTFLKQNKFNVVTLSQIKQAIDQEAQLPRRSVCLTFDDGYRDLLTHAVPILHEFHFKATFYIIAQLTDESNTDFQQPGFASEQLMSWPEIRELHAHGQIIGSHSMTHRTLDQISLKEAEYEIIESKREIEKQIQADVLHFSYPKGHYNEDIERIVHLAGYEDACSTKRGDHPTSETLYSIRRIPISANDSKWDFARKLFLYKFRWRLS